MNINWEEYNPKADQLISLREAAEFSGLSPNHLRLLVGKGVIWGIKIDTYWATTKEAVENYISQEHRTGPKPKSP